MLIGLVIERAEVIEFIVPPLIVNVPVPNAYGTSRTALFEKG